jgi:hypothetical protein
VRDAIRAVHIESVGRDQNVPALDIVEQLRLTQALVIADVRALVNRYGGSQIASNRREANVEE